MADSLRFDRRRHQRAYVPAVASVLMDNACVGHYLVRNLSASGALLLGGPILPEKSQCRLVLQGPGVGLLRLSGYTVRGAVTEGETGMAVRFRDLPSELEEQLRSVVQDAFDHRFSPSTLVVDADIGALAGLAEDLGRLGHRTILAITPLEAVRWLCDLETIVEVAVVSTGGVSGNGADLLAFIGEEFPAIHRVLIHGELPGQELLALYGESGARACVRRPYTTEALAMALLTHRPSRRSPSRRAS